jgi:hypothetical protein
MLSSLFALRWLLAPLVYGTLMVIIWACVKEHRARYIFLAIMSVLPVGMGFGLARELYAVNTAETQFELLCRMLDKPAISSSVQDITSLYLDMRAPQGTPQEAAKHAELPVLSETFTQAMVQGANRYSSVEFQSDRAPLHLIEADPGVRRANPGNSMKSHKVLWKSLSMTSRFVTKGTLVIKRTATDDILAEFAVIQLHAPAVKMLGGDQLPFRFVDAKDRVCPSTQNLARIVKSVTRPALIMSN